MQDEQIVALYWDRKEDAIRQTQQKYGAYLSKIAYNILSDFEDSEECVNDTIASSDSPSSLVVNGKKYLISSYLAVSDELPDGFVHAGEADIGGLKGCLYFINPDVPEWVYVNPNEPDVILVSTQWHTAPVGENGEKDHSGFNVFIRYNCPLA